jgi:pyrimidine-specific ribonucleoside hydrolase
MTSSRVPVIVITDLYHPHQDPGDNFDLVAAYALPEVDLRAVILDVTQDFLEPQAFTPFGWMRDGPRAPGFVPVTQLNTIFDRVVPCGVGPYSRLRHAIDAQLDAPAFQQSGVRLLLQVLREAREAVEIAVFGSARALAAAFNREPALLLEKVRRVHLSAGSSSDRVQEWNVWLDPHAFTRVLESGLNLALYPCATANGPFESGVNNTYWALEDLAFVRDLHPKLRRYLHHAFSSADTAHFLHALEVDPLEADFRRTLERRHLVWETAVWTRISDRRLVRRADASYRLIPRAECLETDVVFEENLLPCQVEPLEGGLFRWSPTTRPSRVTMYHRVDPRGIEFALREALPALYASFLRS